jgi:hypothetical protein
MFKIKLLLLCIPVLVACHQDGKLNNITTKLYKKNTKYTIDTLTGDTLFVADAAKQRGIRKTRISYESTHYDFGTVTEGKKVKKTFTFRNTGTVPLKIFSAYGSCGCTIPTYPKELIAPGESGEILVEFNSKGRVGPNTKSVIVSANTLPQETQITFTVNVVAAK